MYRIVGSDCACLHVVDATCETTVHSVHSARVIITVPVVVVVVVVVVVDDDDDVVAVTAAAAVVKS